jgi:hypothetical protein
MSICCARSVDGLVDAPGRQQHHASGRDFALISSSRPTLVLRTSFLEINRTIALDMKAPNRPINRNSNWDSLKYIRSSSADKNAMLNKLILRSVSVLMRAAFLDIRR